MDNEIYVFKYPIDKDNNSIYDLGELHDMFNVIKESTQNTTKSIVLIPENIGFMKENKEVFIKFLEDSLKTLEGLEEGEE